MKRTLLTCLTLATLCLHAPLAVAGEAPSPEDEAAARKLLEDAAAARAKNDFATCRDDASAAWKKFHHAQIAGLLGLCEVELGLHGEGANHLAEFLKTAVDVSAASKQEAQAALDKAKVHVAEVSLACTPSGVELLVDGKSVGMAPVTVYLEPGEHLIEAKKDGYEPGSQRKNLLASTEVKVEIVLEPIGAGERASKPVWPFIVGGTLAAAGVGVGVAGTVVALGKGSKKNDLAASATCKPVSAACLSQGSELAKQQGTFQTMGTAGFIVGGAALAATVIYAVVPAPRKAARGAARIDLLPVVGPSASGLWLGGSF